MAAKERIKKEQLQKLQIGKNRYERNRETDPRKMKKQDDNAWKTAMTKEGKPEHATQTIGQ